MVPTNWPWRSCSGETVTPTGIFLPQRLIKSPSPRARSWRGGWVLLTRSMSQGSRLKIVHGLLYGLQHEEISVSISEASLK